MADVEKAVPSMADDNGWAEHKRLVMAKLDEHSQEISTLRNKLVDIQVLVAPIPRLADRIEQLMAGQRAQDVATNERHHPSWVRIVATVLGIVAVSSLTASGLVCSTPQGYRCGAQDIAVSHTDKPSSKTGTENAVKE